MTAAVIAAIMAVALMLQLQVTTRAFDSLEGKQLAQDSERLRIGLDAALENLRAFATTNSAWDDSYRAVRAHDTKALTEALTPADTKQTYQVDGVLGVDADTGW